MSLEDVVEVVVRASDVVEGVHSREGVLLEEISLLLYEKVRLSSYRFLSWLILKLQAVGTEEEALERILSSRIPQNVPKRRQRGSRICLMELRGMDLRPQSSMPLC